MKILRLFGFRSSPRIHKPARFTCLYDAVGEAMAISKRRGETIKLSFPPSLVDVSPTSTREEIYASVYAQDPRTNEERINASVAMINAYKASRGEPPLRLKL